MIIRNYLRDPIKYTILALSEHGLLNWMPDAMYLRCIYWARFKKKLNLNNPRTFNEKLQWLKLYDRKPEYTVMVDKYAAKQYVAERIGQEYIIPTYGVWDHFDDIDFDSLPDQFVLKCTHDSGGLVICKDKSQLDREAAKEKLENSLKRDYYKASREWPYKDVKPQIIAEKYMQDTQNDALTDYKFFCFDGVPKVMYISKDHGRDPRTDFFDMEFNHLDIKARDPHAEVPPTKPAHFDEMKHIAQILSKGKPHLRVDFYIIEDKVYVGELTFYHMSGLTEVTPPEWNLRMGDWIKLPTNETKNGRSTSK